MLRSIAIHFLLAVILLATQVSSKPSNTKKFQFPTQYPYAVAIDSRLFIISKNQTHIRIDSDKKNYIPCEVAVNKTEYGIPERIKATVLGSKKIVVYGVHNSSENLMIKSVFHTVLIIDPQRCELKKLEGLIQDKVPLFFPVTLAEIVVRKNNQFDVFYLGPKECAPCRFDDEGRKIQLNQQYKADRTTPMEFHVKPLEQNGGYAYALNLENGSSVLKVLDPNFTVLSQFSMNNSIFDVSTSSRSDKVFIGVTYNIPDSPYEFFYTLFNHHLQPIFTNRLEEINTDHLGLDALSNIDLKGNSIISFQQMSEEEGDSIITVVSYDSNGIKISNSSQELIKIPDDALYEAQSLMINDHKYCFALHKVDETFGETTIQCINVNKGT
ncbi:uncharacterized protein LOC131672572 [Phymastichus coffea]|uniref:uncharacterized protein LOC131672572 n=1 Tax=Phymastichus coffea TaxID=108790 RepID=UPI00273BBD34|nr:uncharacterized protein LOC131672572 [Phymastichus coffea]